MNRFFKKALSTLGSALMVLSMISCSASAEKIPGNLTIKNSAVLQLIQQYINQDPFKTRYINDRYTRKGSISGTTFDYREAVPVLRPNNLSCVTILVPEKNKLGRIIGYTTIYISLNPNPVNTEGVINYFNTAGNSEFVSTITGFNLHGGYLPSFDEDAVKFGLSPDEPNSRFYLEFGEKREIILQKI
ncbi:MAG: hypothetical protein LBL38_00950 [Lactobacillales bacterium]|jgi:hypothetical protein|nr:hypothetical protein [Lactobacillales bacterium]